MTASAPAADAVGATMIAAAAAPVAATTVARLGRGRWPERVPARRRDMCAVRGAIDVRRAGHADGLLFQLRMGETTRPMPRMIDEGGKSPFMMLLVSGGGGVAASRTSSPTLSKERQFAWGRA